MMKRSISSALLTLLVACGGGGSPAAPTPTIAQVAGVWSYTARITSVTGGECVGLLLQSSVGSSSTGTVSITQSGANLTATTRSDVDGSACQYTGTAGRDSISLGWQSCEAGNVFFVCGNGARRDALMATNSINASINGRTGNGTQAQSYNVVLGGTSVPVAMMTLNATFTATKQ